MEMQPSRDQTDETNSARSHMANQVWCMKQAIGPAVARLFQGDRVSIWVAVLRGRKPGLRAGTRAKPAFVHSEMLVLS